MNTLQEILERKEELESRAKVYNHLLDYSPELAKTALKNLDNIYQELADLEELEEQKEKQIIEISDAIIASFYK
jgi:predicted  nucleic acid-binding Zn-ribbon protein